MGKGKAAVCGKHGKVIASAPDLLIPVYEQRRDESEYGCVDAPALVLDAVFGINLCFAVSHCLISLLRFEKRLCARFRAVCVCSIG